ncbi:MAG: hypothetical protein AAFX52_13135 [Pseudomonadota bacterium]
MGRWNILLAVTFVVGGCTTVEILEQPPDVPQSYFGFVRVRSADPADTVRVRGITMGGAWVGGSGVGVGYLQNNWVTLGEDCQVIILMKNDEQADEVTALLKSSEGWEEGSLCIE